MIQTQHLTKHFLSNRGGHKITGVEGLDLSIPEGQVFGFLGPNGAGKTTTVRMLAALIEPSAGSASVCGYEIGRENHQIRRSIGILTETPGLYERLSAQQNLALYAHLHDVSRPAARVEKYLRLLGLWNRRYELAGTLSKGMRQKLAIARALLHEPRVLFLDEPTSGLDPEATRMVRDFIADLKKEGRTIVLCTHNLDEADRLCDHIGIFNNRLVAQGSPEQLRRTLFGRKIVFHLAGDAEVWAGPVRAQPFVQALTVHGSRLVVTLADPERENPLLVSALVQAGAPVQFIGEMRYSLEDIYLHQINGESAGAEQRRPQ